jgi:hypothetical protein
MSNWIEPGVAWDMPFLVHRAEREGEYFSAEGVVPNQLNFLF